VHTGAVDDYTLGELEDMDAGKSSSSDQKDEKIQFKMMRMARMKELGVDLRL
jgi:hypothetical protein